MKEIYTRKELEKLPLSDLKELYKGKKRIPRKLGEIPSFEESMGDIELIMNVYETRRKKER